MLNDEDIRTLYAGDLIWSCRESHTALPVHSVKLGPKGGARITVYTSPTARGKLMTLTRKNFKYWAPTLARSYMEFIPWNKD